MPMPMETLGGWHEATMKQVKKKASAQARQTGVEQSEAGYKAPLTEDGCAPGHGQCRYAAQQVSSLHQPSP